MERVVRRRVEAKGRLCRRRVSGRERLVRSAISCEPMRAGEASAMVVVREVAGDGPWTACCWMRVRWSAALAACPPPAILYQAVVRTELV